MTKPPADPVELARSVTRDVFEVLVDVMTHPEATHANRLSAGALDRQAGYLPAHLRHAALHPRARPRTSGRCRTAPNTWARAFSTGITGNRADGVIWDDLIKGREQADSALIRQKTWDAYFDDLLTRKKPRAFEIGITTRWHEDDVAGRILPGELWRRERLHRLPRRQPLVCRVHSGRGRARRRRSWARATASASGPNGSASSHFAPFKRNARTWAALYQQRPAPEEGDYFKARWLKPCEKLPPQAARCASMAAPTMR